MRKDLILVAFPTMDRGRHFVEDNILPITPLLKRKDNKTYESEKYILRIESLKNTQSMRGYNAKLIFLSDECSISDYNNIILPNVKGDHNKIKVVF